MKAVIPIMRNQRNGKIVNITSMRGRIAIPFHSTYYATKFALEGLSESVQYELDATNDDYHHYNYDNTMRINTASLDIAFKLQLQKYGYLI